VIGVFYTPDFDNGISTLGQKLSFVILPLVAITGKPLNNSAIRFLKFSFIYSCLLIIVVSTAVAIFNFFSSSGAANFDANTAANYSSLHSSESALWMYFSYIQLLHWADLHPAYFSMYLVFCLTILFTEKANSKAEMIWHFVIGAVIGGFVAMLASRMAIIALFLSMVFLISKRKNLPVFQIITTAAIFILLAWLNPVTRFRVVEEPMTTTYKVNSSIDQWNSVSYRLLEWQGSLSVINSHLLFGVGTSGWKSAMKDFYSNFNASTVGLTYNSHNQFLQTWMENGLFALIALAFCIFGSVFGPKVDPAYITFILIFSLMCMTESILDRQKGIVFFTMFQSLFLAFKSKPQ
jgi:hypothetical protein